MTRTEFVERIAELYTVRGSAQYSGEAVTQLEHALQTAHLAEKASAPPTEIVAALLHDFGHLLHAMGEDRSLDDRHEELGVRFLAQFLPPAVTEPIRLHVQAKRYLCSTDPVYFDTLSPASVVSLKLQGGPMTVAEAAEFERNPHLAASVALRERDDEAKVPGQSTPPFAHFLKHLEACLVG